MPSWTNPAPHVQLNSSPRHPGLCKRDLPPTGLGHGAAGDAGQSRSGELSSTGEFPVQGMLLEQGMAAVQGTFRVPGRLLVPGLIPG